jgi:hypothetical protein
MTRFLRWSHSNSAALIVWGSISLTDLRLSLEASNWLLLWYVYGWQRVARDHLSIVRHKPQLVVSNGDLLQGLGPLHFLFGVSLWIPTTIAVFTLVMKLFAPKWWRRALEGPTRLGGAIGTVAVVALFVTILGLPLVPALVFGTLAAVLGLCWLGRSSATGATLDQNGGDRW